jgi:phosphate transport system permease protein
VQPSLQYSIIPTFPNMFGIGGAGQSAMNESGVSEVRSDSMSLLAVKAKREKNSMGRGGLQARRRALQNFVFGLFRLSAGINGMALLVIVYFLVTRGWRAITWTFLTQAPMDSMTKGGILPCIVGTICLSLGAILVAFPIGVASAIYLHEYAKPGRVLRIIRLGINNLAGVPSVVFGLFGLAFFVVWLHFGVSILAGALTLGALTLPVIIGASEEALRSVPDTYREASLGLGATKWQTIYRVVLPAALPGILTGAILGISRAAGETAPIMFTAAVFFTPSLPSSIFDEIMALPYHIYVLATAGTEIEVTRPLQYGTALVLITLVLGLNLSAIIYRARLRKRMR